MEAVQLCPALPAQLATGGVLGDGAGPAEGGGAETFASVLDAKATRGQAADGDGVHGSRSSQGDAHAATQDGAGDAQGDELLSLLASPVLIALLTPAGNQTASGTTPSGGAAVAAISPAGSGPDGLSSTTAAPSAGAASAGSVLPPVLPAQVPAASQSGSNAILDTGATQSSSALSIPVRDQGDPNAAFGTATISPSSASLPILDQSDSGATSGTGAILSSSLAGSEKMSLYFPSSP